MAQESSLCDWVKNQADIVRVVGEYVRLSKRGDEYVGFCPFHANYSRWIFVVYPAIQFFRCWDCGQYGDVFKFVMLIKKCSFEEAVRVVAQKCDIPLKLPDAPHDYRKVFQFNEGDLVAILAAILLAGRDGHPASPRSIAMVDEDKRIAIIEARDILAKARA